MKSETKEKSTLEEAIKLAVELDLSSTKFRNILKESFEECVDNMKAKLGKI